MSDTARRLDLVEQTIKQPKFRQSKGLGNEVGYYIFDYPAEDEMLVRERIDYIQKKIVMSNEEFEVAVFDLYDIVIDILEQKGYMEKCFAFEKKRGFEKGITRSIANMLRINDDNGLLVQYIQERTPEKAVIFINGVGKCYPFIRSHKILNNLHQVIDRAPVVMFYPGRYDGQELVLFGEIKDDNYYRAFRLVD